MPEDSVKDYELLDPQKANKKKKKPNSKAVQKEKKSVPVKKEQGVVEEDEEQSPAAEMEECKPTTPSGLCEVGMAPEMRRLLRAPRYFDQDFEEAAIRCFNCGGSGHMSYQCTNEKKQRPCFLCGGIGHQRFNCPNGLCFKCQQPGHTASFCDASSDRLALARSRTTSSCLRCGREGHSMTACTQSYTKTDLALVQCFVCFKLGHLCCGSRPAVQTKASCYNCGEGGHLATKCKQTPKHSPGAAYAAQQAQNAAPKPTVVCFRCGGPHMKRECTTTDAQMCLRRVQSYGGTTSNFQVQISNVPTPSYPVYHQQGQQSAMNARAFPIQTNAYPQSMYSTMTNPYPRHPAAIHHSNSAPALQYGQYSWSDGRSHQQAAGPQTNLGYGKRSAPYPTQYDPLKHQRGQGGYNSNYNNSNYNDPRYRRY